MVADHSVAFPAAVVRSPSVPLPVLGHPLGEVWPVLLQRVLEACVLRVGVDLQRYGESLAKCGRGGHHQSMLYSVSMIS